MPGALLALQANFLCLSQDSGPDVTLGKKAQWEPVTLPGELLVVLVLRKVRRQAVDRPTLRALSHTGRSAERLWISIDGNTPHSCRSLQGEECQVCCQAHGWRVSFSHSAWLLLPWSWSKGREQFVRGLARLWLSNLGPRSLHTSPERDWLIDLGHAVYPALCL